MDQRSRRLAQSADDLSARLARDPGDERTRLDLVRTLLAMDEAERALDTLAALSPSATEPGRETLLLGLEALAALGYSGQAAQLARDHGSLLTTSEEISHAALMLERARAWLEAAGLHELALKTDPGDHAARLGLIRSRLRLGQDEKAVAAARKGSREAAYRIEAAGLLLDRGLLREAVDLLSRLRGKDARNPGALTLLAEAALQEEDISKALKLASRVGPDTPWSSRALRIAAQASWLAGEADAALEIALRGMDFDPSEPAFSGIAAEIHLSRRNADAAEPLIRDALESWPQDTDFQVLLARVHHTRGEMEQALAVAESLASEHPENPEALNIHAFLLAEQGRDLRLALEQAERAVALAPEDGFVRDTLAVVLLRANMAEDAWAEIHRAAAMAGEEPAIWEHLAEIAEALGHDEEAATAREAAKALSREEA